MDAATAATATAAAALVWFRKGLRVHDNPALDAARRSAARVYPVFVLDPRYLRPDPAAPSPGSARAGVARVRFLLENLRDLDARLRRLGSRLLVLCARDDVSDAVCAALKDWNIGMLCFESDTEPYALARDKRVTDFAAASGIEVFSPVSHTLFDPAKIIEKNGGRPPLTYQSFVATAGEPPKPVMEEYSELPPIGDTGGYELLPVPKLEELGYGDLSQEYIPPFRGGETEALKRMRESLQDKEWVAKFEKPKGYSVEIEMVRYISSVACRRGTFTTAFKMSTGVPKRIQNHLFRWLASCCGGISSTQCLLALLISIIWKGTQYANRSHGEKARSCLLHGEMAGQDIHG